MRATARVLITAILFGTFVGTSAAVDDSDLESQLDRAKQRVVTDSVSLRYKMKPGDQLSYRVEHLATVETRIQGTKQTSQSRSVSTKL